MYLTAQRVRVTRGGQGGINAFVFRHGSVGANVNWEAPDFDELITRNPGDLVARSTQVRPGGNHVLSFLDVLAPDAVTGHELGEAFQDMSITMPLEARRWQSRSERVSARFIAEMSNQPPMREFIELSNRLIQVFQTRPPEQPSPSPLVIRCVTTKDSTTLALDESSRRRLLGEGGPKWVPGSLTLDHAVQSDLADAHPNYVRDIVLVLTGLDDDALARIGGARVVGPNGTEWFVWPPRESVGR